MNLFAAPNRFEQLVMTSPLCVVVVADEGVTDIELIRIRPALPQFDERVRELQESGRALRFVGVVGVKDGQPVSAFAEPLSETQITALSRAFLEYLRVWFEKPQPAQQDDSVAWLERLYMLEDPRPEV